VNAQVLLPCPFCGAHARTLQATGLSAPPSGVVEELYWYVRCVCCEMARTPASTDISWAQAEWNRREKPPGEMQSEQIRRRKLAQKLLLRLVGMTASVEPQEFDPVNLPKLAWAMADEFLRAEGVG
jgi:hypothetical protein